jgi:hypothetical protein
MSEALAYWPDKSEPALVFHIRGAPYDTESLRGLDDWS